MLQHLSKSAGSSRGVLSAHLSTTAISKNDSYVLAMYKYCFWSVWFFAYGLCFSMCVHVIIVPMNVILHEPVPSVLYLSLHPQWLPAKLHSDPQSSDSPWQSKKLWPPLSALQMQAAVSASICWVCWECCVRPRPVNVQSMERYTSISTSRYSYSYKLVSLTGEFSLLKLNIHKHTFIDINICIIYTHIYSLI